MFQSVCNFCYEHKLAIAITAAVILTITGAYVLSYPAIVVTANMSSAASQFIIIKSKLLMYFALIQGSIQVPASLVESAVAEFWALDYDITQQLLENPSSIHLQDLSIDMALLLLKIGPILPV
jgi:hypothetical protein